MGILWVTVFFFLLICLYSSCLPHSQAFFTTTERLWVDWASTTFAESDGNEDGFSLYYNTL